MVAFSPVSVFSSASKSASVYWLNAWRPLATTFGKTSPNRRSPCGEQLFAEVFPVIVAKGVQLFSDYSDADYEAKGVQLFSDYSDADYEALERTLAGLKATISAGTPL